MSGILLTAGPASIDAFLIWSVVAGTLATLFVRSRLMRAMLGSITACAAVFLAIVYAGGG